MRRNLATSSYEQFSSGISGDIDRDCEGISYTVNNYERSFNWYIKEQDEMKSEFSRMHNFDLRQMLEELISNREKVQRNENS